MTHLAIVSECRKYCEKANNGFVTHQLNGIQILRKFIQILKTFFMMGPRAGVLLSSSSIISAEHAWKIIESGGVFIDVRSPPEVDTGSIPKAINIPHNDILDGRMNLTHLRKTPLVIFCAVGGRAEVVRVHLLNEGFATVFNGGGFKSLYEFGCLHGLIVE